MLLKMNCTARATCIAVRFSHVSAFVYGKHRYDWSLILAFYKLQVTMELE